MPDSKALLGMLAVLLTFVGYAPYLRDILKGTTRPHVFSWLVWSVITGAVYALQVSAGAGPGSWVTLALTVLLVAIFFLSLKHGSRDIERIDVLFLALALLAIPLWLLAEQPVLSMILLSATDMLGFLPTIRKSWNDPYSETLSLYTITTFRHGISLFALEQYNVVTMLFPATWVVANAAFSALLIARRRVVPPKHAAD